MDIKDTKEFEKEFSYLEPQPPKYIPTQLDEKDWHWIKDFIIQDRIKLTLAILDNDIERLYKDNLLLIYQIEKDKLFSKGGSVKLKEYNFIEKIITYKKEQRELINKQN